jgi:hypothetical protein
MRRPHRARGERRAPSPAAPAAATRPAGPGDTPAREDPWTALGRELDRSRRYGHPLTLVRIAPGEPSGHRSLAARARREGRPGRRRDPLAAAVAELRATVRSGDLAWADDGAVFLLLPETDARATELMMDRIRVTVPAVGPEADVRVASFPEHGLTAHGLRAAVTAREPRFRPSGAPLGELEWRTFTDRLNPSSHPPDAVPEGAD